VQEQPAIFPVGLPQTVERRILDRIGRIACRILRFRHAGEEGKSKQNKATARQKGKAGPRIQGQESHGQKNSGNSDPMIGVAAQDLLGPIELFGDQAAHQKVGPGHRA
jgi:hypothetical protein